MMTYQARVFALLREMYAVTVACSMLEWPSLLNGRPLEPAHYEFSKLRTKVGPVRRA